jgi:hypothetical protein
VRQRENQMAVMWDFEMGQLREVRKGLQWEHGKARHWEKLLVC